MNKQLWLKHIAHSLFGDQQTGSAYQIARFEADPNSCFLVSFPRTGSHWLRMVMELYFKRPMLTRTFVYTKRKDYLLLHTHDMELQLVRQNVIYLYRSPVNTVYSQINYYGEPVDDRLAIVHWSTRYALHLSKWLVGEKFTKKKTVLRYEQLRANLTEAFRAVSAHFDVPFDKEMLAVADTAVTKERVKQNTAYNNSVMTISTRYEEERQRFRHAYGELIWEQIYNTFDRIYGSTSVLEIIFPERTATREHQT